MSGLNTIPPCPSMKPVAPPPSLLLAMAKIFRIRDKDSEDVSRPNNEKKQLRDEDILTVYPSTAIGAKEPRQPCQIHIKHMDRIGAGSFGIVWKIEVLKIKRPFALKFCEVDPKKKFREMQIMDSLVHKNIVRLHYFSVFENPDARNYLVLIMEFVPVNLQKFAQRLSRENHFSVQLAKLIGLQIFTGVEYLHRRGIMHRDLKTHNMQIARRSGKVKICDFGSAKFVKPGEQNSPKVGTSSVRAPELLLHSTSYSFPVDLWSMGCLMGSFFQPLCLPMFLGNSDAELLFAICRILDMPSKEDVGAMGGWELPENAQRPPMIALQSIFHGEVPPEAIDLVKNLLLYNPQKRLNARQAREHIFFDEFRTRVNNGKDLFSIVGFNAVEIF